MEATEWIWFDGKLVKWEQAQVHVLAHTLHYGTGVFEGIRVYQTDQGPAVFRLKEHIDRLCYSAKSIGMDLPYSAEELVAACMEIVKVNNLQYCYIRPIAFYGYGTMRVSPEGSPVQVAIACWPWGAYLPHDVVDVKVSNFRRISPLTTVSDAKICGHYINSLLAIAELQGSHYHEALLLDTDGFVAEGPGENVFGVRGGRIFTPELGSILAGITRITVIELARELGYTVDERPVLLTELQGAEEAFFSGTAAEVTPIGSINDRPIGDRKVGPITARLRARFLEVVSGQSSTHNEYLSIIK